MEIEIIENFKMMNNLVEILNGRLVPPTPVGLGPLNVHASAEAPSTAATNKQAGLDVATIELPALTTLTSSNFCTCALVIREVGCASKQLEDGASSHKRKPQTTDLNFDIPHAIVSAELVESDVAIGAPPLKLDGARVPLYLEWGVQRPANESSTPTQSPDISKESDSIVEEESHSSWQPHTEESPNTSDYVSRSDYTLELPTSADEVVRALRLSDLRSQLKQAKKIIEETKLQRGGRRSSIIRTSRKKQREPTLGSLHWQGRGSRFEHGSKGTQQKKGKEAGMGKGKETFQVWSTTTPVRRPGTRANPSESAPFGTPNIEGSRKRKKQTSASPKGMKSSALQPGAGHTISEGDVQGLKNATPGSRSEKNVVKTRSGVRGFGRKEGEKQKEALNVEDSGNTDLEVQEVVRTHTRGATNDGNLGGIVGVEFEGEDEGVVRQRKGKERNDLLESDAYVEEDSMGSFQVHVLSDNSVSGESVYDKHGNHRGYAMMHKRRSTSRSPGHGRIRSPLRGQMLGSAKNRLRKYGRLEAEASDEDLARTTSGRHWRWNMEGSVDEIMYEEGECSRQRRRRTSPFHDGGRGSVRMDTGRLSSGSDDAHYRYGCGVAALKKVEVEGAPDETTKRRQRRQRQTERDSERRQRERRGLRAHYITVNHKGIPYGNGVGAWRAELNKLTAGLDLSVMNIRNQKEEAMATLRRRLKEKFEYSAPVDRAHIRMHAGRSVTQRRSKLLVAMKAGADMPAGMDDGVWRRLDRILQDPSREALSQRMKYANACRVNKGRTGPKGEDGIWEDLQKELGRELDPDEVQYEMRRKKGYEGVALKRKSRIKQEDCTSPPRKNATSEENDLERECNDHARKAGKRKVPREREVEVPQLVDEDSIRRMERQLQDLQSSLRAARQTIGQTLAEENAPSSSEPTILERRNVTTIPSTGTQRTPPEKEGNAEGEGRKSPAQKHSRNVRK